MNSSNFYIPESALAIMAHPDDIEFSCAGTLARWARAGTRVCYCLCTSGDVGISKPGVSSAQAAEIREREQRAAAHVIRVADVVFLREPDGMLQPTLELRKKLVREIRRFRPEVVICGDPTIVWAGEGYINHPDHRAAATAAVDAIFPAAGQSNLFAELEAEQLFAFKPRKVFVAHWQRGDHFISIDSTIDAKLEALHLHASQFETSSPEKFVRERAAQLAKGKEMEYAEAFSIVTLEDDETWDKYHGDVRSRYNGVVHT